ncbi:MAG: DEAD/DEAH box helicase [Bacilli bacterium]
MVEIRKNDDWRTLFLDRYQQNGQWDNWHLYSLAIQSQKALLVRDFYDLQCLRHLPDLQPHAHQLSVVHQVICEMNGVALLADEVGLGKTIEAGLVLKEYMIRGLVKKVLILVPASLINQWCAELNQKFLIPAIAWRKGYDPNAIDVLVTSLDLAKRAPYDEQIKNMQYDCIIIDEAHKLKNEKTKNYQFVKQLQKKYCLLLTATPVQNQISELFNLVSLLKPGYLGNYSSFKKEYNVRGRDFEHDEILRQLLQKVMIRNRRQETGIQWTARHVENIHLDMKDEERKLYEALHNAKEDWGESSHFSLLTLLRECCSSREAVYTSLVRWMKKKGYDEFSISPRIQNILQCIGENQVHSKAEKVLELVQQINDKVIVFTEYRATQLFLQWYLKQHGISSVPFRGGFKKGKKDWMQQIFQQHAQVFIATEAGGEGINLQFCHHLINYDLPWNPMRLEQRIGRVHRLGQEHDVRIYNLVMKDTIEAHVLTLLHEKIDIFQKSIGDLDRILSNLPKNQIDRELKDIFLHSQSAGEMSIKWNNLTSIAEQHG